MRRRRPELLRCLSRQPANSSACSPRPSAALRAHTVPGQLAGAAAGAEGHCCQPAVRRVQGAVGPPAHAANCADGLAPDAARHHAQRALARRAGGGVGRQELDSGCKFLQVLVFVCFMHAAILLNHHSCHASCLMHSPLACCYLPCSAGSLACWPSAGCAACRRGWKVSAAAPGGQQAPPAWTCTASPAGRQRWPWQPTPCPRHSRRAKLAVRTLGPAKPRSVVLRCAYMGGSCTILSGSWLPLPFGCSPKRSPCPPPTPLLLALCTGARCALLRFLRGRAGC